MKPFLITLSFLFLISCKTDKKTDATSSISETSKESITEVKESTERLQSDANPTRNTEDSSDKTAVDASWLVILSGSELYEEGISQQLSYDFETVLLNSSSYDNLNDGWFITCIPFKNKEDANKKSKELNTKNIKNYVKFSGKRIPLILNHHYLVYAKKYMLLDIELDEGAITEILGYDIVKPMEFMAMASCNEEYIPEQIRKMLNKSMVVFNQKGQSTTAQIINFMLIGTPSLHWGEAMPYEDTNISEAEELEKAAELIAESKSLRLVAVLDIAEDFESIIAYPDMGKAPTTYTIVKSPDGVLDHVYNTEVYKKNVELAEQELEYVDETQREKNWVETMKTYAVDDRNFTYINLVFGDACDNGKYGNFYANIALMWDHTTKTFEQLEIRNHYSTEFDTEVHEYDFTPIFISDKNPELIGFITENFEGLHCYFKKSDTWQYTSGILFTINGCD